MQKQFSALLNATPELRPLLSKAQTLSRLEQHFMAIAPDFLAAATRVSDISGGCLTLIAQSPAVAAKLRQMTPDLVKSLRQRGCAIEELKIRVEINTSGPSPQPRVLGPHAREAIQSLEKDMGDSPLKQALSRLTGRQS